MPLCVAASHRMVMAITTAVSILAMRIVVMSPTTTATAACEQIWRPPASYAHEMVHIDTLGSVYDRARMVCSQRHVPSFRCHHVAAQILEALQDMADHEASEALVNITLDHTLEYEVTLMEPAYLYEDANDDQDDGGDQVDDALASSSAPSFTTSLKITPEEALDTTIARFCTRHRMQPRACDALQREIHPLVERDWGCQRWRAAPAAVVAAATSITAAPTGDGTADTASAPSSVHDSDPQARTSSASTILPLLLDGVRLVNLTIHSDTDVELEAARQCRKWQTDMAGCAHLLRYLRAHVANPPLEPVQAPSPPSSAPPPSSHEMDLSRLVADRLHPQSQRIYFDAEWRSGARVRNVCVLLDAMKTPVYCGPLPMSSQDMVYVIPDALPLGPHMVLITEASPSMWLPQDVTHRPSDNTAEYGDVAGDAGDAGDADADGLEPPLALIAARHFVSVRPTVEVLATDLAQREGHVFLILQLRTAGFRPLVSATRVCIILDSVMECVHRRAMHFNKTSHARQLLQDDPLDAKGEEEEEEEEEEGDEEIFRVSMFHAVNGTYECMVLLVNEYGNSVAGTIPMNVTVSVTPGLPALPRDPSFFYDPPLRHHVQRPTDCPHKLAQTASWRWLCALWRHEWGVYSQNGEDGVLAAIFHQIGVHRREYVEFGTEDGRECNTRFWREAHGWTGLLMDGRHANASLNLHREWVTAENVNALFARYGVSREFDLLSIDVNFNDYWILRALDQSLFSPRVIVIECNSHIKSTEARVVPYNATGGWDGVSDYFGMSVAMLHEWGRQNGYSLVYCESRGVSCFLIRDDVLLLRASADGDTPTTWVVSDVLHADHVYAPPNFFGRGIRYPHIPESEEYPWVWLEEDVVIAQLDEL